MAEARVPAPESLEAFLAEQLGSTTTSMADTLANLLISGDPYIQDVALVAAEGHVKGNPAESFSIQGRFSSDHIHRLVRSYFQERGYTTSVDTNGYGSATLGSGESYAISVSNDGGQVTISLEPLEIRLPRVDVA